jgi:L-methionine (R)-S-oxide reductase
MSETLDNSMKFNDFLHDKTFYDEKRERPPYNKFRLMITGGGHKAQGHADIQGELQTFSVFMERHPNLDDCLEELAVMAARLLNTENCSIMLLKGDESAGDISLRVFAHSGNLPKEAYGEAKKLKEGIAGHVAATGKSVFVENIDRSQFATLKRGRYKSKGFMAVPIKVREKVIGVINANTPKKKRNIDRKDLELLSVIALLIGKSIQVIELQNLLESRYAQFAMASGRDREGVNLKVSIHQSPENIAKILAKSFFSEMLKAGFGPDHMISTATEILSLLDERLKKHGDRFRRG